MIVRIDSGSGVGAGVSWYANESKYGSDAVSFLLELTSSVLTSVAAANCIAYCVNRDGDLYNS